MAILITFLFSFFVQSAKLEKRLESARSQIFARNHLQIRLQDLLTGLSRSTGRPSFYTQVFPSEKTASLVLLFDNGIDPDPLFSGPVIGRIYLDKEENLCLAYWPLEVKKNRPWRKEILFFHASDLEFQFLGQKKEMDPKVRTVTAALGWHPRWTKERANLPSMVRLLFRQEEIPLQFVFFLPTFDPLPTYQEKGGMKL